MQYSMLWLQLKTGTYGAGVLQMRLRGVILEMYAPAVTEWQMKLRKSLSWDGVPFTSKKLIHAEKHLENWLTSRNATMNRWDKCTICLMFNVSEIY